METEKQEEPVLKLELHPARTVVRNGKKATYLAIGEGTLPIITFSIGSSDELLVTSQMRELSRQCRIVVVRWPEESDPESVVDVGCIALAEEGFDSAIWFGSSVGGMMGLSAARYRPANTLGLVLANTSLPVKWMGRAMSAFQWLMFFIPGGFLIRTLLNSRDLDLSEENKAAIARDFSKKDIVRLQKLAISYQSLGELEFLGLKQYDKPVLIIDCDDDSRVPKRGRETLRTWFEHAQLKSFEDGGHFPQTKHAREFLATIESFLTSNFPSHFH